MPILQQSFARKFVAMAPLVADNSSEQSPASLLICMVGLPARGKSYITKKICRYLEWCSYSTKIFNVGNRRRQLGKPDDSEKAGELRAEVIDQSAQFFDPNNEEGSRIREQAAMEVLDEALDYLLYQGGCIALFDATNTTIARRKRIVSRIRQKAPTVRLLFVESQCFDQSVRVFAR